MSYNSFVVAQRCEIKGGVAFRNRGEKNGWVKCSGGKKASRVTVPQGRSPLKKGTLQSIARQLLLTDEEFKLFMDCSMKKEEYQEIIDTRHHC